MPSRYVCIIWHIIYCHSTPRHGGAFLLLYLSNRHTPYGINLRFPDDAFPADEDTWDYVSEWQDLEGINLDKLFYIHRQLVTDKVTEYERQLV